MKALVGFFMVLGNIVLGAVSIYIYYILLYLEMFVAIWIIFAILLLLVNIGLTFRVFRNFGECERCSLALKIIVLLFVSSIAGIILLANKQL